MLSRLGKRIRAWRHGKRATDESSGPTPPALASDDAAPDSVDGADYSRPILVHHSERSDVKEAISHRLQENNIGRQDVSGILNYGGYLFEDPLREWSPGVRERIVSNCHSVYNRNPLANSIVEYTTQFCIGEGFNLTVTNQDVEEILKEFIEEPDNAVREYERQALTDLQLDGELIAQFFTEGGYTVLAPRRPWECYYIRTERGFFRRLVNFEFHRQESEGDTPDSNEQTVVETISADQCIFVAINRNSYELRGRPELYRMLPWLKADVEWVSNMARHAKWRRALLWFVKVSGNVPGGINRVKQEWSKPPPPGSVYVGGDGVDVQAVHNSASSGDAIAEGRQIRMMSIMGARLPEYFFGDGHMANLATATRQEMPALTRFDYYQRVLAQQFWKPVLQRVIENAVAAGRLDPVVPKQHSDGEPVDDGERIPATQAFEVSYKPIVQENIGEMTAALVAQAANDWIDDETAMEKLGNDPYIVRKRLDEQREKERDEVNQGLRPPPGIGNPFREPAPGQEEEEEEEEEQPRA